MTKQRSPFWYLGLSAYWFATSFKWFVLLLATISAQVAGIVPDSEKNQAWGMVVMIGALWAVIGPSLFGFLSDRTVSRYGKRSLYIALGTASTVVALAVMASAHSLWILTIGYLLLQISDDIGTGPYAALIPEVVEEEHRGYASGLMGVMRLVAQIASGVVGFILAGSIVGTYIAIALVQIVCCIWVLVVLRGVDEIGPPDRPAPAGQPDSARKPRSGFSAAFAEPWKNADFRNVWILSFLVTLGYYLVQTYLRNYLDDIVARPYLLGMFLDEPGNEAWRVLSATTILGVFEERAFDAFGFVLLGSTRAVMVLGLGVSLCGILGALWCAKVADRLGRKRVVRRAGWLMFLPLIPFALVPDFGVIALLVPFFGFGYGAYVSATWALASDVMPTQGEAGKDMGIWQASWSSVQVVAGALGAMIDAVNRIQFGAGYTAAILIGAVLFKIGTSLVRRVRGSS
ncbi:MAG: MFS transporter [Fimbriimonadaceae bacterium]